MAADDTSKTAPPADDDDGGASLREPVIDLVSDLADTWTVTSLAKTYVDVLQRVAGDDAPPPALSRGRRVYKVFSSQVPNAVGNLGGAGLGGIARLGFFLLDVWLALVRRRPVHTLLVTFAIIAAVVVTTTVRNQQAATEARHQQASVAATRESVAATRAVDDRDTLSILAKLDADFALADPALFGRGSQASALRCTITMTNHDERDPHTVDLTVVFAYARVPTAETAPGATGSKEVQLRFYLSQGATNVASEAGSPTLIELDMPANEVERVDITSVLLSRATDGVPRREVTPPPTGCNYVRPSAS